MSFRLESLPTELFHQICGIIKASEPIERQRHKTFVSLSLTSKRCRSVAALHMFYWLSLEAHGFGRLRQEVTQCIQSLRRLYCIHTVIYVQICGSGFDYGAEEGTKLGGLLQEFPQTQFFRIYLHGSRTGNFFSGARKIMEDCGWTTTVISDEVLLCHDRKRA